MNSGGGFVNAIATNGSGLYIGKVLVGRFILKDVTFLMFLTGGNFAAVGPNPAVNVSNIAYWDGVTNKWSVLGSGVDSIVNCLLFNGSYLYIGIEAIRRRLWFCFFHLAFLNFVFDGFDRWPVRLCWRIHLYPVPCVLGRINLQSRWQWIKWQCQQLSNQWTNFIRGW